ncbi:hypothetical protein LXA43DRAFT_1039057 [Ganoderma leucocontextum]|nr:hypothetical protein LXA43DRAFT_1039057 [Ganoderma leucocontextum]
MQRPPATVSNASLSFLRLADPAPAPSALVRSTHAHSYSSSPLSPFSSIPRPLLRTFLHFPSPYERAHPNPPPQIHSLDAARASTYVQTLNDASQLLDQLPLQSLLHLLLPRRTYQLAHRPHILHSLPTRYCPQRPVLSPPPVIQPAPAPSQETYLPCHPRLLVLHLVHHMSTPSLLVPPTRNLRCKPHLKSTSNSQLPSVCPSLPDLRDRAQALDRQLPGFAASLVLRSFAAGRHLTQSPRPALFPLADLDGPRPAD